MIYLAPKNSRQDVLPHRPNHDQFMIIIGDLNRYGVSARYRTESAKTPSSYSSVPNQTIMIPEIAIP